MTVPMQDSVWPTEPQAARYLVTLFVPTEEGPPTRHVDFLCDGITEVGPKSQLSASKRLTYSHTLEIDHASVEQQHAQFLVNSEKGIMNIVALRGDVALIPKTSNEETTMLERCLPIPIEATREGTPIQIGEVSVKVFPIDQYKVLKGEEDEEEEEEEEVDPEATLVVDVGATQGTLVGDDFDDGDEDFVTMAPTQPTEGVEAGDDFSSHNDLGRPPLTPTQPVNSANKQGVSNLKPVSMLSTIRIGNGGSSTNFVVEEPLLSPRRSSVAERLSQESAKMETSKMNSASRASSPASVDLFDNTVGELDESDNEDVSDQDSNKMVDVSSNQTSNDEQQPSENPSGSSRQMEVDLLDTEDEADPNTYKNSEKKPVEEIKDGDGAVGTVAPLREEDVTLSNYARLQPELQKVDLMSDTEVISALDSFKYPIADASINRENLVKVLTEYHLFRHFTDWSAVQVFQTFKVLYHKADKPECTPEWKMIKNEFANNRDEYTEFLRQHIDVLKTSTVPLDNRETLDALYTELFPEEENPNAAIEEVSEKNERGTLRKRASRSRTNVSTSIASTVEEKKSNRNLPTRASKRTRSAQETKKDEEAIEDDSLVSKKKTRSSQRAKGSATKAELVLDNSQRENEPVKEQGAQTVLAPNTETNSATATRSSSRSRRSSPSLKVAASADEVVSTKKKTTRAPPKSTKSKEPTVNAKSDGPSFILPGEGNLQPSRKARELQKLVFVISGREVDDELRGWAAKIDATILEGDDVDLSKATHLIVKSRPKLKRTLKLLEAMAMPGKSGRGLRIVSEDWLRDSAAKQVPLDTKIGYSPQGPYSPPGESKEAVLDMSHALAVRDNLSKPIQPALLVHGTKSVSDKMRDMKSVFKQMGWRVRNDPKDAQVILAHPNDAADLKAVQGGVPVFSFNWLTNCLMSQQFSLEPSQYSIEIPKATSTKKRGSRRSTRASK